MPKVIVAKQGECLCGIAQSAGFLDCKPLRAEAANAAFLSRPLQDGDAVTVPDITSKNESAATTKTNVFKAKQAPPITLRFVHGSPDKPYGKDLSLTSLNVSKYITDRGGTGDGNRPLPDEKFCEFESGAHADVDTFKVEAFDPRNKAPAVKIVIEALRPVYDGSGAVKDHVEFPGSIDDPTSERGKRSLKSQAKKQGQQNTMRFRTPYLRLVVDEADKSTPPPAPLPNTFPPPTANQPRPQQAILVTDMTDQGDPKVEILDQLVRATFELDTCPASPKCKATVTLPIGTDRRRLRLAVHVLRSTVGGAPVVPLAAAKRRVTRWCRRVFAQAGIGPNLVLAREVDPVGNLVCISDPGPNAPQNAGGRRAAGDGQLGFTINAAGKPAQVVGPINPPANQTALATATALAALVQAPYSATVSPNPRRFNDANASCDLVIKEASGATVTLSGLISTDTAQTLSFGNANPLPNPQRSWDGQNFLVGTPDQRVICKNHKSGSDRIDVFVIRATSDGNRGEAMMHGHSVNTNAATHGKPDVAFSLFVIPQTMDGTDSDPLVLSHETSHVVGDVLHATAATHQLMHAQVTGNQSVGGSKRIRNSAVAYDNSTAAGFNLIKRLRSETAAVLEPW
jgi:hypothetical protein